MGQQYPLAVIREVIHTPIPGEWGEPAESDEHETVKIIRTTNFTNEGRINYSNGVVDRVLPDKVVTAKRLKPGDIIIEKSGGSPNQPVGRVVYFDRDDETFLCNNFTAVIRVLDRGLLWPRYLHWGLYYKHQCGDTLRYQNKTTGIINLQLRKYIETETIPLPPIDTQRKIAAVLDKAQELIDLRKAQIEKLDEFLRSVFLDMFGDPVTNPKGWDMKPIGSIAQVQTGSTPSRDNSNYYNNGLIPWIKTGEVTGNMIFGAEEFINLKALDDTNCKVCPKDTILLAMYGQGQTRGRAGLLKIEAATNQACAAILPAKCLNSLYLFCQIRNRYDELRALGRGGNQPNLNLALVKGFEVLVPPLPLQQQFAAIVEKTEQQKTLMQQSLTEMENNFNSLMQRAFRGELF